MSLNWLRRSALYITRNENLHNCISVGRDALKLSRPVAFHTDRHTFHIGPLSPSHLPFESHRPESYLSLRLQVRIPHCCFGNSTDPFSNKDARTMQL